MSIQAKATERGKMMPRQHHYLKTESKYFQDIEAGRKTFELRVNDRDFKKYDIVYLQEVVNGEFTGRQFGPLEIKYILYGGKFGLPDTHCIFSWVGEIP